MKQKSLKLFKPHWRGLLLTLFASCALVFVNIALRRYLGASLDAALNGQIEIVRIALVGLTGIAVYAALSGVKAYGAQMLQHMNIGILQCGGYCRTKKVVGNQAADQSDFVIGVLHDTPPLDVGVKQTGV